MYKLLFSTSDIFVCTFHEGGVTSFPPIGFSSPHSSGLLVMLNSTLIKGYIECHLTHQGISDRFNLSVNKYPLRNCVTAAMHTGVVKYVIRDILPE